MVYKKDKNVRERKGGEGGGGGGGGAYNVAE